MHTHILCIKQIDTRMYLKTHHQKTISTHRQMKAALWQCLHITLSDVSPMLCVCHLSPFCMFLSKCCSEHLPEYSRAESGVHLCHF